MTRRYDEPIEVSSALADPDRVEPEAFIWRGRLFVVRAVIDRWHERRAWWREVDTPAARTPAPAPAGDDAGMPSAHRRGGQGVAVADAPPGVGDAVAERERQVWRVEASPGRTVGTGVFDLGSDGVGPDGSSRWVLLRAHD